MKKLLPILILSLLPLVSNGQKPIPYENYISYYDSSWKESIDFNQNRLESLASNYSPYGEVFTPKGTIRLIFDS